VVTNIKPYNSGYLAVGNGHELYYEQCGNPKGFPVLFLHGGPGAGFKDKYKQFFNLSKINLTLFDQRGAGRSKPFASMKYNTTPDLLRDIDKLLTHLSLKKVFLSGTSWGSTLALLYAIKNPYKISGLLIAGTDLADNKNTLRFLNGGIKHLAPSIWERFVALVPESQRSNVPAYYYKKMRSQNKDIQDRFAFEWALYENCLLAPEKDIDAIEEKTKQSPYLALGLLEARYLMNDYFVPKNYILKNAKKLSNTPLTIIHGNRDLVCDPTMSRQLNKAVPHSKLIITNAGHGSSSPENKSALIREMEIMYEELSGGR